MFPFDSPLHELLALYGFASLCAGWPLGAALRRRFALSAARATAAAVGACFAGFAVGGGLAFVAVAEAAAASFQG